MKYKSGEKILVRNSDEETWRQRWFVAYHPFRFKVVTVDCTGVLSEWFKSNSIKNGSKENSLRGDGEREVKERYSEDEGCRWFYNGTDGSDGSYRVGDAYWWYNNN
tara:strand:+ start:3540 stop:3857 length:318 start_codon:yes stop_codon:yes gene_type:complete